MIKTFLITPNSSWSKLDQLAKKVPNSTNPHQVLILFNIVNVRLGIQITGLTFANIN